MNAQQFFQLVASMREAQREYFKTRSRSSLERSKALERRVDDEIKRVTAIRPDAAPSPPKTPGLFDES